MFVNDKKTYFKPCSSLLQVACLCCVTVCMLAMCEVMMLSVHDLCLCPVSALSSEAEPDLTKGVEAPRFTQPLQAVDVKDGQSARFETVVSGSPPPQVTWFREGIQIPNSQDFQIVQEGNRSILFIREVLPEDAGVFTCRLTNAAGVAECSAELFVEGK